ncbi:amidase [Halobellus ruber]|uniref:Asp-tRNA(Asn)/Glu-tRNA(Gln) amidotransferase subunit GatA n=1 Tax=Halobellus ruber TaxID=2761102 RepID=A0A7J9SNI5_9EURY|nr:amidase [Halobellus ruber]MBB6646741.1 Asp-tRNA(Asn)/Glu-tRNA(Gln) amidotransferase subunit GatA [Halobellus ruber]
MHRFGSVSENDVESLAGTLGLTLAAGESEAAADRLDALADVYAALEDAPAGGVTPDPADGDRFETAPFRPPDAENRYNQWLTRFALTRDGATGDLDGLDVALKDNMCVRGVELTCGSRALEGFVPGDHATVVDRLLETGATLVGKTNMDEFAFGPTSETSAFGPTANPVDADHVAGGSSSGSAAAVAAGEVDLALGTDTGGSVRMPASYCGIVGVKPSYGAVPTYGVADLAHSMDHVGTLARDVETAVRGLDAIADAQPGGDRAAFSDDLGTDPERLRVGVAPGFFEHHVSEAVERRVRDAVDELRDAGAEVRPVEVPALEHSREAWWGIAPVEFAATFATNAAGVWREKPVEPSLAAAIAGLRGSSSRTLGPNVKQMLLLGAHLLQTHEGYHYVRGQHLRARLDRGFDAALADVDVLATPTTPTTALAIDGFERGTTPPVNWDTHPTNLTGHPSVSVPCGEVDGLPVGLQFVGAHAADATVLDVTATFESVSSVG